MQTTDTTVLMYDGNESPIRVGDTVRVTEYSYFEPLDSVEVVVEKRDNEDGHNIFEHIQTMTAFIEVEKI